MCLSEPYFLIQSLLTIWHSGSTVPQIYSYPHGSQNHDVGWVSPYHMNDTVDLCWRSHPLVSNCYNWHRRSQLHGVLSLRRSSIVPSWRRSYNQSITQFSILGLISILLASVVQDKSILPTRLARSRDYWGFSLSVSSIPLVLTATRARQWHSKAHQESHMTDSLHFVHLLCFYSPRRGWWSRHRRSSIELQPRALTIVFTIATSSLVLLTLLSIFYATLLISILVSHPLLDTSWDSV